MTRKKASKVRIACLKDLCDHFGVDDARHLEKVIYKGTACGAWITFDEPGEGPGPTEKWSVRLARSITKDIVVHSARRAHGRTLYHPEEWPKQVCKYMLLSPGSRRVETADPDGIWEELGAREIAHLHRFTVLGTRRHIGGVTVGSIVEGVDQCVEPRSLRYPFALDAFFAALDEVEAEADRIWEETHGCEECGEADPDTGYTPINPNCAHCHGAGTIL